VSSSCGFLVFLFFSLFFFFPLFITSSKHLERGEEVNRTAFGTKRRRSPPQQGGDLIDFDLAFHYCQSKNDEMVFPFPSEQGLLGLVWIPPLSLGPSWATASKERTTVSLQYSGEGGLTSYMKNHF